MTLSAYDRLLIKLCHELLKYLQTLGASQQEAEDISQDIFILAWQLELKLAPPQLRVYLRKAAKSRLIDHWRHQQRKQQMLTRYGPQAVGQIIIDHTEPAVLQEQQLQAILQELNIAELSLLLQRYQQGNSLNEIAQANQTSVAAVKMRLYRLKRKIRRLIGGKNNG
ncbi:RNA polymerase sigma factor [Liquorilactobacillus sicerae]|uniref:RNA polymerase sigma factor n=1 Tax=Liquorilactobacillus sicerae TaxID=1416943 RepID=UPI0024810475|nr:sigma-70 family RNA polymerase sigma factor [Liquorilactobacillus sicerae]